jgi:hypothetical protein
MNVRAVYFTITDSPDNLTFTNAANTSRSSGHVPSFQDNGAETPIILISLGADLIAPGTGSVMDMTFDVAGGAVTTNLGFTEVQIADEDSNLLDVITVPNEVVGCSPGDLDNDGDVDLFDVLRAVDIVLEVGPDPTPLESCAADIDEDGDVDLFDILAIVDIILGA